GPRPRSGQAVPPARQLPGREGPTTATACDRLAANLNRQGKYQEAEEGFRKALALRLKVLGEEHPQTAASMDNVASNLAAQGKLAEAEAGYRKALALRQKLLGEEPPEPRARD